MLFVCRCLYFVKMFWKLKYHTPSAIDGLLDKEVRVPLCTQWVSLVMTVFVFHMIHCVHSQVLVTLVSHYV